MISLIWLITMGYWYIRARSWNTATKVTLWLQKYIIFHLLSYFFRVWQLTFFSAVTNTFWRYCVLYNVVMAAIMTVDIPFHTLRRKSLQKYYVLIKHHYYRQCMKCKHFPLFLSQNLKMSILMIINKIELVISQSKHGVIIHYNPLLHQTQLFLAMISHIIFIVDRMLRKAIMKHSYLCLCSYLCNRKHFRHSYNPTICRNIWFIPLLLLHVSMLFLSVGFMEMWPSVKLTSDVIKFSPRYWGPLGSGYD